ncbi:MAG: ROK family protein [Sphingomonadaceae bacterium]
MKLYGGVEAGGTKFVCMVGSGPQNIRAEITFPTTNPVETIGRVVDFFRQEMPGIAALGVGSFGPIDPNPASPTYGYITTTPKPGWVQTNIVGMLRDALDVPVVFDTDVNAAAFGEYRWGAARGEDPAIYVTVGTGIGGGIVCGGAPIHGLVHPEMGHMLVRHDRERDPFPGICPFHGDCLEGLASGPALAARWGQRAETLPDDHPAWGLEAHYIAQALANLVLTHSPRRIVIGGGVMRRTGLYPLVRDWVRRLLNGYVQSSTILQGIDSYIVPPGLGNRSGVLGAIALAQASLVQTTSNA